MLRQGVKDFIGKYFDYSAAEAGKLTEAKIHVDEVASSVAAFYERIRNLVDYREEHLLRKHIIGRALHRRLFFKDGKSNIAEPLIREIIRSGHLPNDSIPENRIPEVQKIIERVLFLLSGLESLKLRSRNRKAVSEWITGITVSAIEETLDPPKKDEMTSELMFNIMKETISIKGDRISNQESYIHLMIAIEKALLKSDYYQIHYRLLKFIYPEWLALPLSELINFKDSMDRYIESRPAPYFLKLTERYNTVFYLLSRLVFRMGNGAETEALLTDESKLENTLKADYQKLYTEGKSRLARLAILSIISFFFSKIVIALAVEIPIDRYITHNFSVSTTILSIVFPPILMFLIILSMRLPSKNNFNLILKEIKSVIYEENKKEYLVSIPVRKPNAVMVYLFYFLSFSFSAYIISVSLLALNFSVMNIIIFSIFTSLVIATGIKIGNRAKEISLEESKGSAASFILDLLVVPFAELGKWVMKGLSKVNVLVAIMDLIVELPFQVFVEFLESFRNLIVGKKEEIK